MRRRYPRELQQQAVEYWRQRRADNGLRTIAASLGVTPTTLLHRWTHAAATWPRLRPIVVIEPTASHGPSPVVIRIRPEGPRVEGLTVETAARLLILLR